MEHLAIFLINNVTVVIHEVKNELRPIWRSVDPWLLLYRIKNQSKSFEKMISRNEMEIHAHQLKLYLPKIQTLVIIHNKAVR